MTGDELDRFENLLLFCCSHDKFRRAPVGQAVEMLPEAVKELLRTIKSDDLKNIRPDYIKKNWL